MMAIERNKQDVAKGGVKGKAGFGFTSGSKMREIFKATRRVEENKNKSLEALLDSNSNSNSNENEEEKEEEDDEENSNKANDGPQKPAEPKKRLSKADRKRLKSSHPSSSSLSDSNNRRSNSTSDSNASSNKPFYITYDATGVSQTAGSRERRAVYESHLQITDGKQRLEDAIFDVGAGRGGHESGASDDPTTRVRSVKFVFF